jgi:uncharacterized protein (DUF885 family)
VSESLSSAASDLAAVAEAYWRAECEESTLTAMLAGQPSEATYIFRLAPADADRRDQTARGLLESLERIPTAGLDSQDRVTHALLRRELEAVREQHRVRAHLKPWLLPGGPEFNAVFFANSTALDSAAAADLYLQRLRSIPGFLEDVAASMRLGLETGHRYPRFVLEGAIANIRAAASITVESSPWFGPLARSPIKTAEFSAIAERAAAVIRDEVLPSLSRYADFLAGPMLAGARETIACTDAPLGREYYEAFVRLFTTLEMTPDEIHALGLSEVVRLEAELTKVASDAGFDGDLARYRDFMSKSSDFVAANPAQLRNQLEAVCKRIDGRIPAFFSRLPRITYGVDSIPLAMSQSLPPAYAQPSPADYSAAGVFWITSLPERCPSYLHLPFALHEAWPGHLMHIALMQEATDLPAFRRNGAVKYTVTIEGWALYCESLGVDMGLYATPHEHFGRLQTEMWRAVRLVLDTGIHWLGWSRSQAIDYFMEKVALPRDTIEQEVDRYIAMPAQALAYQIGNICIRELRRKAETALGPRFSFREFHSVLMGAGAVSLPILEQVITAWIEAHQAGAPPPDHRHAA